MKSSEKIHMLSWAGKLQACPWTMVAPADDAQVSWDERDFRAEGPNSW